MTPLARVGLYVPGGTASYPSTVLMDCIPAKLAGVREVIMATVSYTHLDVYKRQCMGCTPPLNEYFGK